MWAQFWHDRLKRPFKLHYEVYGNGPVTVLLLHGIASSGSFWQPLIDELDHSRFTLIVPDLLGHGASPRPPYLTYSTADQAVSVLALLKRLKVRHCLVVGHSMGCLVASRLTAMAPARVERLLLYEPPLFADLPEFKSHARRRKFYLDLYARIAANPAGRLTMTRLVARISKKWTAFLASDQTWLPIERSLRNAIIAQESFEELKDIAVQTDIVHGRLDVIVPKAQLKDMLSSNPNISFFRTTDRHGLSRRSARYLARLISEPA
ncbi:MAG TPA: alpha/beta hydrolase [Candidatus Saccharimonadales bacterium]|nr:alpha/beta hydrolase [Candidatus Saccharimonadales bacterium]